MFSHVNSVIYVSLPNIFNRAGFTAQKHDMDIGSVLHYLQEKDFIQVGDYTQLHEMLREANLAISAYWLKVVTIEKFGRFEPT